MVSVTCCNYVFLKCGYLITFLILFGACLRWHYALAYCCVNLYAGLYLYAATESKLTVDTSRGERLHINVSANAHSVIPNFPFVWYF